MNTELSEGKVIDAEYLFKRYVPGLAEVAAGWRPLYPTTIYNVSGDDSSGVAGLLKPDGEFIAVKAKLATQRFWEHEETDRYVEVTVPSDSPYPLSTRIVGDSWREGEVVWDGSAVGGIDLLGIDGDETDEERNPVFRRTSTPDELTGEWPKNDGELWRAFERGTGMAGQTIGHTNPANRRAA